MLAAKMMMAAGAAQGKLYVDDVFSSYLRTGTGADAVVTTGIDMTQGYMLWTKRRSSTTDHMIFDSVRGVSAYLSTNTTTSSQTDTTSLKSVSSTGYTYGNDSRVNANGATYVDFVFKESGKFFKPTTISHTNGTPTNIAFPSLETLGMVVVKITNTTGDWLVWHRSLTAGNNLKLNLTDAQSTTNAWLSVSGTTATLSASAPTGSYVVYGWAHDAASDGIIQCGGGVFDATNSAYITLGWEPAFVLWKNISQSTDWYMHSANQGMSSDAADNSRALNPNSSAIEIQAFSTYPTATGFSLVGAGTTGNGYIYLAIRRPNKPPTTGTQVFNQSVASGVFNAGFPVDMHLGFSRAGVASNTRVHSRLTGWTREFVTSSSAAQTTVADVGFDSSTGLRLSFGSNEINYLFKRAPGCMDVVCDTGTGSAHTIAHNLTVAPELVIRKSRSGATQWEVWHSALAASEKMVLNSTAAKVTDATAWNGTAPTASVFTVGTGANVNTNAATYVTYLFATLAGISKCGSYTGNGTSQTINCGFTTGARFVMIKRTDSTGDWYVWDTARGIIAGNDPHLSLNTTAAEVTTDDSIDPDSSGFIVNQVAATNINVNAASYIYLAIA